MRFLDVLIVTRPLGSQRSQGSVSCSLTLHSGSAVPWGDPFPQPVTSNGSGIANGTGAAGASGNATNDGNSTGDPECHGSGNSSVEGGRQSGGGAGISSGNGTSSSNTNGSSAIRSDAAPAANSVWPAVTARGLRNVPTTAGGSDSGGGSGGGANAILAGPLFEIGVMFASKEALLGKSGMDKLGCALAEAHLP